MKIISSGCRAGFRASGKGGACLRPYTIMMNIIKTLVYMGSMHGFFTFFLPYQISLADRPIFDPGIFRYPAVSLWLVGTLIIIWCSVDFVRRGRGTPAHMDPPKILIVNGLYRHVRNPIYVGALLVQLGYILWFASGIMMIYFLFFLLAFHVLIVFIEEPILRNTFGMAYEEYCRSVPRWVPRFR